MVDAESNATELSSVGQEPEGVPAELLESFRSAVVLLCMDHLRIRDELARNGGLRAGSETKRRVLDAAVAVGLVTKDALGSYAWSSRVSRAADDDWWSTLLAIVRHQISYLNLVSRGLPEGDLTPTAQARLDTDSYLDFLRGVEISHLDHARWVASHPSLSFARRLVDVGGGLGTFSKAWIASDPARTAAVMDLPSVVEALRPARAGGRLEFLPIDLTQSWTLPPADLYLFGNVLHLFDSWRDIVWRAIGELPRGGGLAILEASPEGASGALFDLQVHLRSGLRGGLLAPADIEGLLRGTDLSSLQFFSYDDAADPFRRRYGLWVARR